jgi:hypothetical protein
MSRVTGGGPGVAPGLAQWARDMSRVTGGGSGGRPPGWHSGRAT